MVFVTYFAASLYKTLWIMTTIVMKLSETLHFINEYLYLCTTYSTGVSFIMNLISNHKNI